MHTETTRLIEIEWKGPYLLSEIAQIKDSEIDYGLYQIYGRHPVYGSNVLLYIGKADRQTIGKRVSQEAWDDTNDSSSIKIYVGRLIGSNTPEEIVWSEEIDLAERMLINVHKPAYNSKSIARLPDAELQNVHILNWGDHCSLLPEVSGFRWTSKLYDVEYDYYRYK
ncbi:hypothetical protein [Litchfieldia alkalitelluris]|uniref:hypothetical protein n=1 Tax=Litchfieldia alkalitelluris TaxID=304268 RepID=UPI000998B5ED|nr:hypothetical protein [Litchfieldia alkalitelluris]